MSVKGTPPARPVSRRRALRPAAGRWRGLLGDPRNAVLAALGLALFAGGGRRWLRSLRAREAVRRLDDPDVTPEAIGLAGESGRGGIMDLFRLLETASRPAQRIAAGRALAALWARDDLVAEEEKAIVRRGYEVAWHARRRYPRALRAEIPVEVEFGVPFLIDGAGVSPANLEWSYRVVGARRASLESASPFVAGPGRAVFRLIPGDFESHGPHQLVLQTTVRTVGLSESWELELPHKRFAFEFDPLLQVGSLLTLPDATRAETFRRGVRLRAGSAVGEGLESTGWLPLGDRLAIRGGLALGVATALPCDLAHSVALEFEGLVGAFPAGSLVAVASPGPEGGGEERYPLAVRVDLPAGTALTPGQRRVRAVLTADPDLGWAHPEVRSVWPDEVTTDWAEVEVLRL